MKLSKVMKIIMIEVLIFLEHIVYIYMNIIGAEAYKNYKEGYLTESDGKLCPAIYEYFGS